MPDPLLQGYYSLQQPINKVQLKDTEEGVVSDLLPELTLDLDDDELIKLKKQWEKNWDQFQKDILQKQTISEDYWLGSQFTGTSTNKSHMPVDNVLFTSLETFLPIATRSTADPIVDPVERENDPKFAKEVRKKLIQWADDTTFNLKLKQVARYWSLYFVGVGKIGYSMLEDDITFTAVRPQKLILDPDATIEKCEYTGDYVGEIRKDNAKNLIARFPAKKDYIEEQSSKKLGTKIQYIEWWSADYVFWTLNDEVLGKSKNPHWDWQDKTKNHFKYPKIPYVFLSVFNLGKHPVDDTSLFSQNIPLQDLINKRLRQIDKNADKTNGALALSGDAFTKEQATTAGTAVEKGGTLWVPSGDVNRAVVRLAAEPLPAYIYQSLIDYRNELANVFGTRGSTPQGVQNERALRSKMLVKQQDTDRINGGISTYLEQFADGVMNWVVQMMYIYGKVQPQYPIQVGVKDGSMIPHDPTSERTEALQLWAEGALDPITFFERLDFPDPKESAKNLLLWKMDPLSLFPELAQMKQQQEQSQNPPAKPPSESLNYKDAPEDIKRQIEAQAGLQPSNIGGTVQTQHEKQMAQQSQMPSLSAKLG